MLYLAHGNADLRKASARQAWRPADDGYAADNLTVLSPEDRCNIPYEFHRVAFAVG